MMCKILAVAIPLVVGAAGEAAMVPNTNKAVNVETGILYGDGVHDDAPAIQAQLDSGLSCVALPAPAKHYAIGRTLRMRSGQTLRLEPTTVIRLLPGSSCTMLVNDPAETNAHDIRLVGGIWDMDNANQSANPFHPEFASDTKYPYKKYGGDSYSTEKFETRYHLDTFLGCAIQFYGIRRLEVRDVTVRNPVTYAIQCGGLTYFTIENIRFDYEGPRPHRINMDGVHLDGPCKFGVVRNLQGTTYDDLLALNADDMASGPIESIAVDGIFAKDCLRAVRLLSAVSRVSDITIANVFGTFYSNPFEFSQYYETGKRGDFGRISIRNVFVSCGMHPEKPAWEGRPLFVLNDKIDIEYLAIDNFHRDETYRATPAFRIGKDVRIRTLALSNITMRNRTGKDMIFMDHHGAIERLVANNLDVTEAKPVSGAGKVGEFITDGSCPGLRFLASPGVAAGGDVIRTFSIVAADPETGVCGAAVASKYPAVGKAVPHVRAGVGAFCTQYWGEPGLGAKALDLLEKGKLPEEALGALLADDVHRDKRQLAIVDMQGRCANRNPSGADLEDRYWGLTGRHYACQGNTLAGRAVITDMAAAYEDTAGSFADRLVAALLAADRAGGDRRGRLAAGIRIAKKGAPGYWLELYVDNSDQAVEELARQYSQLEHEAKGKWGREELPRLLR